MAVLYFLCVKTQTNALIVQKVGRNTEYWRKNSMWPIIPIKMSTATQQGQSKAYFKSVGDFPSTSIGFGWSPCCILATNSSFTNYRPLLVCWNFGVNNFESWRKSPQNCKQLKWAICTLWKQLLYISKLSLTQQKYSSELPGGWCLNSVSICQVIGNMAF